MTLWLVLVLVVAALLAFRTLRSHARGAPLDAHRRVIDTLDTLSSQAPPAEQGRARRHVDVEAAHQHVRLVRPAGDRAGRRDRQAPAA